MGKKLHLEKLISVITSITVLVLSDSLHGGPAAAQSVPANNNSFPVDMNFPTELEPDRAEAYLLGVGDYIKVDVFNIPDYGGEFRVLSGGVLHLPVVGSVTVAGLSLPEAATLVEQRLEPFVRRPRVTLSLLEIRPLQVAIAGEVHRPGAYRLNEDSSQVSSGTPTLTQAIELAGGITQLADIRQIEVHRRLSPSSNAQQLSSFPSSNGDNVISSGQVQFRKISIDLWDLLKAGNLDADLRLQDGDRILIPTAEVFTPDEIAELASASFSPDEIIVNVVGEVSTPGPVQVPPNTPLNQVILAAGGFNNRAKDNTVNLIRLNPNGTVSEREIDIDFSQGINEETNPSLRPNDTIVVRRSGLTRVVDTMGTVLGPAGSLFNILRLFGL